MRILSTIMLCFLALLCAAQEKGVNFQNNLTWAQVKEKAKKENKYIFADCYTTWCIPCKVMAKEILPQPEVASFLNDKFISVALQFDKTKQDDVTTKRWYKDIQQIKEDAKISAYPTYLIYNPDGQLVNSIVGGSPDAGAFLTKLKSSLDPKNQLINLKKQYAEGNRNPDFLHTFGLALLQSWDSQAPEVVNQYLATQKDLLTKENVSLIIFATSKSTDPGFNILVNKGREFDELTNKGMSGLMFGRIVFDEIVFPIERVNGKREDHGGMIVYSGEIDKNINWDKVYTKLQAAYPAQADELLLKAKIQYYRDLNDWHSFADYVTTYTKQFGNNNDYQVMTYANDIMLFANDKADFDKGLEIMKPIVLTKDGANTDWYIDVYTKTLYKLGRKQEALALVDTTLARLGDKAYVLKQTQEKMKKGEL